MYKIIMLINLKTNSSERLIIAKQIKIKYLMILLYLGLQWE